MLASWVRKLERRPSRRGTTTRVKPRLTTGTMRRPQITLPKTRPRKRTVGINRRMCISIPLLGHPLLVSRLFAEIRGVSYSTTLAYQPYGAVQSQAQAPTQIYDPYAPTATSTYSVAPAAQPHVPSYGAPTQRYADPQNTYGSYASTTRAHDPYAPATPSVPPSAPPPEFQQQGTHNTSFDPYRPSQYSAGANAYGGTTNVPSHTAYAPYNASQPSAPSQPQTHTYPAYVPATYPVNPPVAAAAVPPIPAPDVPKVTVAPFRPKTSNAYDPPIPAPRRPSKLAGPKSPPVPAFTLGLSPQPAPPQALPPPPRGASRGAGPLRPHQHPQPSSPPPPSYQGVTQPPSSLHGSFPPRDEQTMYNHPTQASRNTQFSGFNANLAGVSAPPLPRIASPSKYVETSPPRPSQDTFQPVDDELGIFGDAGQYDPASELSQPTSAANKTPQSSIFLGSSDTGSIQAQDDQAQAPMAHSPSGMHISSPTSDRVNSPPQFNATSSYSPPPTHSVVDPYAPPRVQQGSDHYAPPRTEQGNDQYAPPQSQHSNDYYASLPVAEPPARSHSPGGASIHFVSSVQNQGRSSPPKRALGPSVHAPTFPVARPPSSQSRRSTLSNAYDPPIGHGTIPRTSSPLKYSVQPSYDPYVPAENSGLPQQAHGRTSSSGSLLSVGSQGSTAHDDPYAPSRHPARQSSEHSYTNFTVPSEPSFQPASTIPVSSSYEPHASQVITLAPPTHSMYAPSPSLLGTNDPLGRTTARAPVISFGFGGKLVTCFHGASMNTGFDVALSSRQTTDIKIQVLHKIIPESALDISTNYPGPLFSDPGSPTAGLVRAGASTALKAKKARVIKYLEERAEEIAQGLGYHDTGSMDRRKAEARRTLVLLLKVMVENDGRLTGR